MLVWCGDLVRVESIKRLLIIKDEGYVTAKSKSRLLVLKGRGLKHVQELLDHDY